MIASLSPRSRLSTSAYLLCTALLVLCLPVAAKDSAPSVTAIILYDTPSGPASVQVTGLMFNGKTDLRVCDGLTKFDKRTYDGMPHIQPAAGTSLDRDAHGNLTLNVNSEHVCIVPNGVKFIGVTELTPAEAAGQTALQGTGIFSAAPGIGLPALKPGTQLIFIAAPDTELADYLRAQRANTMTDWQDFLRQNPSSTHAANARNAIAEIVERSAESTFAQYQKSLAARQPDIALLKQAREQAQEANRTVAGYRPAVQLFEAIGHELDTLLEIDRLRLAAYRNSLEDQSNGLPQLVTARRHTTRLLEVLPEYAPVANLHREIIKEEQKLGAAVEYAESLLAQKRFDDALAALGPYRAFAAEMPRIDAVIGSAYSWHFTQGQDLAGKQQWEQATAEFKKALAIHGDKQEGSDALNNAETQLAAMRDRQSVERALAWSQDYAAKKDFIEAYNVLAELPESQRPLVSDQMAALSKDFSTAALRRGQKLQETHLPIRSRADEDALREAHELLDRASAITDDPATKLKRDLLDDKLSAYYVDQARRYLEKPQGSGIGVGWLYLTEAQHYRTTNEQAIKDEIARYSSAYQLRSRLSVGIVLRDQTSRRDSAGFTDQLADAISAGLESSALSLKVVRQPKDGAVAQTDAAAPQPNFLLVGEIREHRVAKNTNLETLSSKYRAGTHEVKNPEWLQASHDYDAAKQQLADAQRVLNDAQAQHKKKEVIAAANDAVQTAQKLSDDARHKLETLDQTKTELVIEPYNYTRKNIEVSALINVGFRITDQSGNVIDPGDMVRKENHKSAVVLENVKPEDTEGVTKQDPEPDETQFLIDQEIAARDELVKIVREKAAALPAKILQEARSRAQRSDTDGAAEQYVLYLNATADKPSPERDEASKFLHDQFNVTVAKN